MAGIIRVVLKRQQWCLLNCPIHLLNEASHDCFYAYNWRYNLFISLKCFTSIYDRIQLNKCYLWYIFSWSLIVVHLRWSIIFSGIWITMSINVVLSWMHGKWYIIIGTYKWQLWRLINDGRCLNFFFKLCIQNI